MECESYLLDNQALALSAYEDGQGSQSLIITLHGNYTSKRKPAELLDLACLRNHATMAGRKRAASTLLEFKQKPPFLLSEKVGVFPTSASIHASCVWIFNHFFTMTVIDKKTTLLTFSSGITITVQASRHILRQQTGRLHMLLNYPAQATNDVYFEQFIHPSKRLKP